MSGYKDMCTSECGGAVCKVIRNQDQLVGKILFADLILIHIKDMLNNNFKHIFYV
jgi:hypothetical protein